MIGKVTRIAVLVVSAMGIAQAAGASIVYNYTGSALNYHYQPGETNPFPKYGERVIAQLTIDEAVLTPGYTGTLSASQFTALIGTSTTPEASYSLAPAGAWIFPSPGSAFVMFSQGSIVDWSFGHTFNVNGNSQLIASTGQGDRVSTYPRAIPPSWPQAQTSVPGTWTLQPAAPVPLPAGIYLLATGVAALGAAARRKRKPPQPE